MIVWEAGALADLREIGAYLKQQSPVGANRVLTFIVSRAQALHTTPFIGRPSVDAGLRELVLSRYPYTVTYDVTDDGDVRILAVTHQARDR